MSKKYLVYAFMPIKLGDPITALKIRNNHVVFGTMSGRIVNYELKEKKSNVFEESSREHISNIDFHAEGDCDVTIGDEKLIRYSFSKAKEELPKFEKFNLYTSPSEHYLKCNSCYTMISNGSLMKILLNQPEVSDITICEYETKNCEYENPCRTFLSNFTAEILNILITNPKRL